MDTATKLRFGRNEWRRHADRVLAKRSRRISIRLPIREQRATARIRRISAYSPLPERWKERSQLRSGKLGSFLLATADPILVRHCKADYCSRRPLDIAALRALPLDVATACSAGVQPARQNCGGIICPDQVFLRPAAPGAAPEYRTEVVLGWPQ